jgi:hypothetical protein
MAEIDDVTSRLVGLPTSEELKNLYLEYQFDRRKIAEHLGVTTPQLLKLKKKLLGECKLPPHSTYSNYFNDTRWFTGAYAEWTHPPKNPTCRGN